MRISAGRIAAYNGAMEPDDEICYCYHVSFRKLYNFARRGEARRPSQMSECLAAGTGCGWCIPILKRIFENAAKDARQELIVEMTPQEYAAARREYIDTKQPRHRFD